MGIDQVVGTGHGARCSNVPIYQNVNFAFSIEGQAQSLLIKLANVVHFLESTRPEFPSIDQLYKTNWMMYEVLRGPDDNYERVTANRLEWESAACIHYLSIYLFISRLGQSVNEYVCHEQWEIPRKQSNLPETSTLWFCVRKMSWVLSTDKIYRPYSKFGEWSAEHCLWWMDENLIQSNRFDF